MKVVAVVLALSIMGCGDSDDCGTQDAVSKRLTIETPTDPALDLRIESCRVDVDACTALCQLALERVQITVSVLNNCKVGFAGERVLMDVDYTPINNECGFVNDDIPVPNGGGL